MNFNDEGEQWAPIGGLDNAWVQIGQLHENVATTCMTYHELTGQHGPTWGLTTDNEPSKKKYILCCEKRS